MLLLSVVLNSMVWCFLGVFWRMVLMVLVKFMLSILLVLLSMVNCMVFRLRLLCLRWLMRWFGVFIIMFMLWCSVFFWGL